MRPNISLGDSLAGLHAAFGTVMALLHQQRSRQQQQGQQGDGSEGLGQVVDAAISESMYNMMEGCVSGEMDCGGTAAVLPRYCCWRGPSIAQGGCAARRPRLRAPRPLAVRSHHHTPPPPCPHPCPLQSLPCTAPCARPAAAR